jgi:hypothetical protein
MMSNDAGCEGLAPDPDGPQPGESDETYRERHGDEPTDLASARHCEIRIDGLPGQLPAGEYRMTLTGMEYPVAGRPVLRFRYVGSEHELTPPEQQRLDTAMAQTQAEAEGWLPPPLYRTRSGKIITEAMIERWAAEAEAGYDISQLRERVRRGQTTPTEAQAEVMRQVLGDDRPQPVPEPPAWATADAERNEREFPDLYMAQQPHQVEVLNVSKLARVIVVLIHAGVITSESIGLVPGPDFGSMTPGVEDWLRS